MAAGYRIAGKISGSIAYPITKTPALLGGAATPFNPASISGLRSRLLDANTFTSPINSKYYLKDSSTTNTHLPRQGRCWLFDGINDYGVATGTEGILNGILTVSFWIKPTSIGSLNGGAGAWMFGDINGSFSQMGLTLVLNRTLNSQDPSKLSIFMGTFLTQNTTSLVAGSWTHVSVVRSGGIGNWSYTYYINGVANGSFSTAVNPVNSSLPYKIGTSGNSSVYSPHPMRDVRIFSVAKDATAITNIYAGNNDITGLIAQYPCNEESGTTGYDISGNGRHLTLTNITQATFHAADTGVLANRNNAEGYRLSGSVYIPKRLNDTLAADGNALTVTGRAAYHGCADTPCVTGNGSAVYVTLTNLQPNEVEFWLRPTRTGVAETYFYQVGSSSTLFCVRQVVAGKINILARSSAGSLINADCLNPVLVANEWVHVRVRTTFASSGQVELWINGVSVPLIGAFGDLSGTYSPTATNTHSDGGTGLFATASMADIRITTAGVTTYFPLQDGPGSSNTNRDIAWVKSDGTGGIISNAIVNGTVSTIWGNRVPGNVEDWCVKYGGRIAANGAFVAGMLAGGNAADGSAKTLTAGKFGNPFSRLNLNPALAAEYNGKNIQTSYEDLPCVTGNSSNVYANLGGLLAGASDCSFSFWANIPAASAQTLISTSGSQTTLGFVIYSPTTSTLQLYGYPSGVSSGSVSFTASAWNFIEVTRVGTSIVLRVNGVASSPMVLSGSLTGVVQLLRNFNTQYSGASIADLRITTGGVTTYFPLSDGSGADLAWYKSDGTKGVVSTALLGTLTNVWANKTAGSKVAATKYALRAIVTRETEFNRVASDGDDRFLIYDNALSGADLTNVEGYVA